MVKKYIPRAIQNQILKAAKTFPVVALTGPRQTGKSTLLKKLFPRYQYVTLDDPLQQSIIKKDPLLFFENNGPFLIIDEIQYAPELLPHIKIIVDQKRSQNGQFILTGSQVFSLMAGISESLAGRVALFELLAFSWEEIVKDNPPTAKSCFNQIFTGFYPEPALHRVDTKNFYGSYLKTYLERDIRQIKSVHDLTVFQSFLELLAARVGSLLNLNEIGKECGISHTTARQWLSLLENTRIVFLLRPYFKNISKRVIKSPKLYFSDTGLLAYLLKYPNSETLQSGPMAGAFFENMLIIEVLKNKFNHNRLYEIYFFRDSHHNEIDLVIDKGDSQMLVEIKMSKSLRPTHGEVIQKIQKEMQHSEAFIISLSPDEIKISPTVKTLPWWKISRLTED